MHTTAYNDTWADEGLATVEHWMACGQLLAAQLPSASTWSPEKRLAAAVLSSALIEIRDHGANPRRRRQVAKTLAWIAADDSAWPYSFVRLCRVFGLQPDWVREIVSSWEGAPREPTSKSGASRPARSTSTSRTPLEGMRAIKSLKLSRWSKSLVPDTPSSRRSPTTAMPRDLA